MVSPSLLDYLGISLISKPVNCVGTPDNVQPLKNCRVEHIVIIIYYPAMYNSWPINFPPLEFNLILFLWQVVNMLKSSAHIAQL